MSEGPAFTRPVGLPLTRERGTDYRSQVRAEPIELLAPPLGRVLDVGCAEGRNAALLRRQGATHLTGIEVDEAAATCARGGYDIVHGSSVEAAHPLLDGPFDTVMCLDVLEHLVDPWETLAQLASLLVPGGRLVLSLPNARHVGVWLPLVARGRFRYSPEGVMDVTHLRFFARRDAEDLIATAGLRLVQATYPTPGKGRRRLYKLTRGRVAELLSSQWLFVAERNEGAGLRRATGRETPLRA